MPAALLSIRRIQASEVEATARMCVEAFNEFNATVGLPPEFPTLALGLDMIKARADPKGTYACLVAVARGEDGEEKVIGTNAINLGDTVGAVGPIAVAREWWDKKVGRALMEAVIEEGRKAGKPCIMLQQVSSNTKSFCLYQSVGFRTVENCLYVSGLVDAALPFPSDVYELRRLRPGDEEACDGLFSTAIPGFSRRRELAGSIQAEHGSPEAGQYGLFHKSSHATQDDGCSENGGSCCSGALVAYISSVTLCGHVLAADLAAFQALLIGVSARLREHGPKALPLSLHVMSRVYPDMSAWALGPARLRLVRQTTIMGWGGPYPTVSDGTSMVYCPSVDY